jgi:hypothetical protein
MTSLSEWSVWLVQRLYRRRIQEATDAYLRDLANAPLQQREAQIRQLLTQLAAAQGPHVYFGQTPSGLDVRIPLFHLIRACCVTTGGMGSGKTMAALLPLTAIVRRLPALRNVGFGVLDAKGELFERAVYLLAARLAELHGRERQELLDRIVIVDFANKVSLSPYNILARWHYAEPDFFITSRLETLKELLPAGEKVSLRGGSVLKNVLMLLSECGLPLTYLDRVLGDEAYRKRLLARSSNEEVILYFKMHFNTEGKQTIAALRARMDSLFASQGVRLALSGSSAPDFLRLQNEGKIVLINCAGPTISRGVRLLLQGLVLSDIRQAIFARPNNPPVTFWWCADEAQNFFLTRQMQENLTDILTMARSFGVFFHFLCQNLTTAVPDARVLETLYTNIRWSLTLRATQRDAGFLRSALPVTGRMRKPRLDPFRPAGTYTPEEERNIVLNGIATLPDREGYLWLKTLTDKAIRIRTPFIDLGTQQHFRMIVDSILYDTTIGGRVTRNEYIQRVRERDQEWMEKTDENPGDTDVRMAHKYGVQAEVGA